MVTVSGHCGDLVQPCTLFCIKPTSDAKPCLPSCAILWWGKLRDLTYSEGKIVLHQWRKKKKSTAHLPSFSSFKFSSLLLNYQHTVELLRTAFAMEAEQHKPIKAIATLAIVQWDVSFWNRWFCCLNIKEKLKWDFSWSKTKSRKSVSSLKPNSSFNGTPNQSRFICERSHKREGRTDS